MTVTTSLTPTSVGTVIPIPGMLSYPYVPYLISGIAYFTPRQKGEYVVNVLLQEKNIKNSPFKIQVGDKELGHAAGCTVKGAITEAVANHPNELIVDTTNGGKLHLFFGW